MKKCSPSNRSNDFSSTHFKIPANAIFCSNNEQHQKFNSVNNKIIVWSKKKQIFFCLIINRYKLNEQIFPLVRAIQKAYTTYYANTYSEHGGRVHGNSFFHSKMYAIIRFKLQIHYKNTNCSVSVKFKWYSRCTIFSVFRLCRKKKKLYWLP